MARWTDDPRTWPPPHERRRRHWLIERDLREELLASPADERDETYRDVYDRLFAAVPWHAANQPPDPDDAAHEAAWFTLYGPLVRPADTLADIGCGNGGLVRSFAPAVERAIGIDASEAMIEQCRRVAPPNAEFRVGSAADPPLEPESIDIAITRQVLEHLHPDDLPAHLAAVRRALRPGGRYLIETPNGLTGPWDVSRHFTDTATGFHLHEYTNRELTRMLRAAGFGRVVSPAVPDRVMLRLGNLRRRAYAPAGSKAVIEAGLSRLPKRHRRRVAGALTVRQVVLVAHLPERAS